VYSFITPTTEYHGYYEPGSKGRAVKDENSKPRYTVLERQGLSIAVRCAWAPVCAIASCGHCCASL
jgi:hypothetical protein